MAKRKAEYRLQVRLVRVPDPRRLIDGQNVEAAHTILDLRLSSLAAWGDATIVIPMPKAKAARVRVGGK